MESDSELHLLDDIAKDLLNAKRRRIRAWIAVVGIAVQMGLYAFFLLEHVSTIFFLPSSFLPGCIGLAQLFVSYFFRGLK